ncbi:MAG: haloacid dehalogenase-like hydrolase [Clostridia bacterium]|nr:haloacid dehalogenase-like hydrolase [Clostridia bacterium]MBQ9749108.1 haloacid dehalogenase-like hydrolase [Clostridia bacterium]
MEEKIHDDVINNKPRMAICYDFDKTLSPDDMQTFTLIPSFGVDKVAFWAESTELAKNNLMDNNLAWMYQLLNYSKLKRLPIKKDYFKQIGADVELYNGVESWFDRMDQYAAKKGIELEHYIISSGLKEIIEGSKIASHFKRIYASSYLYTTDGVAEWPAQAVNYTNKTQFIFRIAKGYLEEYDERVNDSIDDSKLRIPYENIVYIGDSATDIPCMRLVKSKGGYSIGVYDPSSDNRKKVYQLYNDGRISFYAPADYSARGNVSKYLKNIIDEISSREKIKAEQKTLKDSAEMFGIYKNLRDVFDNIDQSKAQKKKSQELLGNIRKMIDGNID